MGETCSSLNTCQSCCNPDDHSAPSLPLTERDPQVQEVVANVLANLDDDNKHSKTQKYHGDNLDSCTLSHIELRGSGKVIGDMGSLDYTPGRDVQTAHEPPSAKAHLTPEMNSLSELVNSIKSKLPPISEIQDKGISYTKGNPELGPFLYPDGSTYYGGYKFGNFEGFGTQVWHDGSIYEGFFINDKAQGKARLINTDGSCYVGEFHAGKANGNGEYYNTSGIHYKGEWLDNCRHGYGEEQFPDGSYYKGQYKNGKKEGNGRFKWADNDVYAGDFRDGYRSGIGKYVWGDGRMYNGEWLNNNMHGQGTFTFPDNRKYVGHYENDVKEGYGEFFWENGDIYRGYWRSNKRHGKGEMYKDFTMSTEKGVWRDGEKVED